MFSWFQQGTLDTPGQENQNETQEKAPEEGNACYLIYFLEKL